MKIIIQSQDGTFSAKISDEATIDDVMCAVISLITGSGYADESVRDWICDRAAEIKREDDAQ